MDLITAAKIKLTTDRLAGVCRLLLRPSISSMLINGMPMARSLMKMQSRIIYIPSTILRVAQTLSPISRAPVLQTCVLTPLTNSIFSRPSMPYPCEGKLSGFTPQHNKAPIRYEFQFAPGTFLLTSIWATHAAHPAP